MFLNNKLHVSDGPIQPKSAIHFDKPFTALQPPRHCSQPLDGSTAPSLSRPASQSDTMQQSGIAPPFNQRLLSSTPAMTPVKVTRPASAEVTGGDPLPLNSSDQVRAVRPPSPPPIIPRLLEGVIAFQPQPCGNMSPGMTTSSRIEPLPPFVGVTSQYMVSSAGQELVQPCEATVYDQRTVAATNLVTAAWMDDYPVRDSTTTVGYAPAVQRQPCVYPLPHGHPGTYPAPSLVSMPGQRQFYPVPSCHGQMGQRLPPPGQDPTAQSYSNSVQPAYPMTCSIRLAQPETRSHPGVSSRVNNPVTVLSHSQEEHPLPPTAVVDSCTSTTCPQDIKDVTLSPPVKQKSPTVIPVKGEFALYSDCGTAEASPVTHNPRNTNRASSCATSKRLPVRSRASESQKSASSRMAAGVGARNTKSLDRDPKSSSRERKKRPPKTKAKAFSDMVDAEVQVGTSGGTHQCDCETATESSEHVTQVKVDEDMEKKCSTARSHLHTLSYLLKELKTVSDIAGHSATGHGEIGRLVGEMEQTVSSLLPGVTTLSWQTEIDLAMLPLRSENAQLRR